MKFSYLSAAAALAMAAALAACGGKAQFAVQGAVVNLNNNGLVLANGGDTVTVPSGATRFSFPKQIDYGTDYNITIQKQPAHMTCGVSGGTGSAGHTVTIEAVVSCEQNAYTLGGQFTGLTPAADGTARTITVLNGSNSAITLTSASATNGAGDFSFGTVKDGASYGVTVVVDPAMNLTCSVANGVGVMHEVAISNLLVTCVPK